MLKPIIFLVLILFLVSEATKIFTDELIKSPTGYFIFNNEDIRMKPEDLKDKSKPFMYVQPSDLLSGKYDAIKDDGVLCARNCDEYKDPRICYYQMTVEQYSTMGYACRNCPTTEEDCYKFGCVPGNGIERTILTINRQIPSPAIEVCEGDRIILDVINNLHGQAVTIHAQGLKQKKSPYMDGTPMVTQCPIDPKTIFRYDFLADTPGTHYYRSLLEYQQLDGIAGPLIIRQKSQDDFLKPVLNSLLNGSPVYDLFSFVIFIQDWLDAPMFAKVPNHIRGNRTGKSYSVTPDSYLINGKGSTIVDGADTGTPLTTYTLKKGFHYRFRIISATSLECRSILTFESHNVKVIAADGSPVDPMDVGSIVTSAGETFDVLLTADQEVSSYWISVKTFAGCAPGRQVAIIKYEGSTLDRPNTNSDLELKYPILNDVSNQCKNEEDGKAICVASLKSLVPVPTTILATKADERIFINVLLAMLHKDVVFKEGILFSEFIGPANQDYVLIGAFNNITNKLPPSPAYHHEFPEGVEVCDPGASSSVETSYCLNLIKIPKNVIVEIVIQADRLSSGSNVVHPINFHGVNPRVMYMGPFDEAVKAGTYIRKNDYPPEKNTIQPPINGAVVLRFLSDNPGMWLVHCNMAYHVHNGMSALMQIGERSDFKKPPQDFPTHCGNYMPPI